MRVQVAVIRRIHAYDAVRSRTCACSVGKRQALIRRTAAMMPSGWWARATLTMKTIDEQRSKQQASRTARVRPRLSAKLPSTT